MEFEYFTIFTIFQKDNCLYMIVSINNREINENELIININRYNLKFNSKHVKNGPGEPIIVLIYDMPMNFNYDKYIVNVSHNNVCKSTEIENIKLEKYYLTVTTLFKDDYKIFPIFYEYYKKQGVEHFYMYYNGIITQEIRGLFNKEDVTLIEWNFKYWLTNCKYIHHAQLGQIHDALYKYGKHNSTYMIFCDLDEYMNIPNITLRQFIVDNPEINTFGFCNHWSQTIDNTIPDSLPCSFLIGNKFKYTDQSKNIYKTENIYVIGIHSSMWSTCQQYTITDLNMFHFYTWSKPSRIKEAYNNYTLLN
jgi:hypothetical protein